MLTICGYTQSELEDSFAVYLAEGGVDLQQLRLWYNGYNFAGTDAQKVYNPFDVLLFFDKGCEYRNYWFETATPTFLIELLSQRREEIFTLESMEVSENFLSTFDVGDMPLETLMWQTGYLTILEKRTGNIPLTYVIGYPNMEVKTSINGSLSRLNTNAGTNMRNITALRKALQSGNAAGFIAVLTAMFAAISYQLYRKNEMANYEGYYPAVVYSYLAALGCAVRAEDATNLGSVDISTDCGDKVWVMELKVVKAMLSKKEKSIVLKALPQSSADDFDADEVAAKLAEKAKVKGQLLATQALQQIKDKHYADKFCGQSKTIYLIGVAFDMESRNVMGYCLEIVNS